MYKAASAPRSREMCEHCSLSKELECFAYSLLASLDFGSSRAGRVGEDWVKL